MNDGSNLILIGTKLNIYIYKRKEKRKRGGGGKVNYPLKLSLN
jgi:hypothetical protein